MYYSSSNDSRRSNSSEEDNFRTYKSNTRRNFVFPPAPRLCRSANNTCDCSSTSNETDSSFSDGRIEKSRRRARKKGRKSLPPIGVFWDIENCQVPKNKSAMIIVQSIRERLFKGYREAEFLVVCDVKKENAQVIQDLHDAQVLSFIQNIIYLIFLLSFVLTKKSHFKCFMQFLLFEIVYDFIIENL